MPTRLGLYLGSNAIGWCLQSIDEAGRSKRIMALGVRAYNNGRNARSGEPLAKEHREVRSMRRRRDRYVRRREALLEQLIKAGLMPSESPDAKLVQLSDPYALRKKALDGPLTRFELGRVLFHLNRKRGLNFNENDVRPTESVQCKAILSGATALDNALLESGARTLGEYLQGQSYRKFRHEIGEDQARYCYLRRHILSEFEFIWSAQQNYHPKLLTTELYSKLRGILFSQRPQRLPMVANCPYFPDEPRLYKAHPVIRRIALLDEINRLRVEEANGVVRTLSDVERNLIASRAKSLKQLGFDRIGSLLKLGPTDRLFQHGSDKQSIRGDALDGQLRHRDCFGKQWATLTDGVKSDTIEQVVAATRAGKTDWLLNWLEMNFSLNSVQVRSVITRINPDKLARTGLSASMKILEHLERIPDSYVEAALGACGGERGRNAQAGVLAELPYYGEVLSRVIMPSRPESADPQVAAWGQVANPSFHIALNQLRRLVNAILGKFGKPDSIAIEMAPDLRLSSVEIANAANEMKHSAKFAEKAEALMSQLGLGHDRSKAEMVTAWLRLPQRDPEIRQCPFCGDTLTVADISSGRATMGYILPFSRTLDASRSNRIVAHVHCYLEKGSRSPWEAWGGTKRWEAIQAQSSNYHWSSRWRFGEDAMSRFGSGSSLGDRHFSTSQYLVRTTQTYLGSLYANKDAVRAHTGRLTQHLARAWGLEVPLSNNAAARPRNHPFALPGNDLRYFAARAAITATMTEALLRRICRAASIAENFADAGSGIGRTPPWPSFTKDVRKQLHQVVVSHRSERARIPRNPGVSAARLHLETAYGPTSFKSPAGFALVVHRIPLLSLSPEHLRDETTVADSSLRHALREATRDAKAQDFRAALVEFSRSDPKFRGIRRLRIRQAIAVVPVRDAAQHIYKGFKPRSNHTFTVWELPNGKWISECLSTFDAHQPNRLTRRPHPAARKVLELQKNDLIAVERFGERELMLVRQFTNGQVRLSSHFLGGNPHEAKSDAGEPFIFNPTSEGLRKLRARQVRIDVLGTVFDPFDSTT